MFLDFYMPGRVRNILFVDEREKLSLKQMKTTTLMREIIFQVICFELNGSPDNFLKVSRELLAGFKIMFRKYA